MKAISRHESEILRLVTLRGSCSIAELAEQLGVSDETVRRHIRPLVDRGQVDKVHGGIVLPNRLGEAPMERRMAENRAAKQAIAAAVADRIDDGETILLDSGSTTAYVALALSRKTNLRVVTNATEIARILVRQTSNRVYLAGGEMGGDQLATFGPPAIDFMRRFSIHHAILSIGGINGSFDLLNYELDEAEFSRAVIDHANRVTVVADSTKFRRKALVRVCGIADIDTFISERPPPGTLQTLAAEGGVELVIGDDDREPRQHPLTGR